MRIQKVVAITLAIAAISGCSSAIKLHSKVSDNWALKPELLGHKNAIYVLISSSPDFPANEIEHLVKSKIAATGREITVNPEEAGYLLQANMLYLGEQKLDITMERSVAGGYGSLLAGNGLKPEIENFVGLVDVLIKENGENSSTGSWHNRVSTPCLKYRTRIGVKTSQTDTDRIDTSKANASITEQLATQIARYFGPS